ncbi:MAG: phosphatase PAP2 family protein [Anaerolineae bacterium]
MALALVLLVLAVVLSALGELDRGALIVLRAVASRGLTRLMVAITQLGSTAVVAVLALGWAYLRRRTGAMAVVPALCAAGGGLTSMVIKALVDRPRPDVVAALVQEHSFSFPSGHSLVAMAFYGAVALTLAPSIGRRSARLAVYATAGVVIILVGVSRVYLGVHYPSDVLGGYSLGVLWLTAVPIARALTGSCGRHR